MSITITLGVLQTLGLVFSYLASSIGASMLFKKKGIRPLYGFIPLVREYNISVVAEREEEGRNYCLTDAVFEVLSVIQYALSSLNPIYKLVTVIAIAEYIVLIVYEIRIDLGLCREFQKPKKWIFGFVLFRPLVLLYWGLNKNFIPSKQVKRANEAELSNVVADRIESGLTLNLEERSVKKFFKKKVLLKDIHLSIPTGHMVLLLGGSGAGKTTFVNAATGYEMADAEVVLSGRNIYDEYDQMKYDLGFVPQQDLMRDSDTVFMTLKDAAELRIPSGVSAKMKAQHINEIMDLLGLTAVKNSLVSSLSGGQKKRLSIAMEIISDPTLFFLDEPDSGLDGVLARRLFTQLRNIANEGKIVIVITHTPDRVIDLFDDVIVLAKDAYKTGRLAYYGPVNEAYTFFGKKSMEEILLSINPKDEGGEARADEFVGKFIAYQQGKAGQMA